MNEEWYKHPRRHPKNVDGPFYSLAEGDKDDTHSECLDCELPQSEGNHLISSLNGDDGDTYFVKQPETPEEIDMAITACGVCCVNGLRYGGKDPEIIKQMDSDECDYKITLFGKVKLK